MTTCPECGAEIAPADINVATDVAFCRACDTRSNFSDITVSDTLDSVNPDAPPDGAYLRHEGGATVFGATIRSTSTAVFFTVFATFWNLVTWILVTGFILAKFGVIPFTGPGNSQGPPSAFMFLFFTPFVLVGFGTAGAAIFLWFGRVELRMEHGEVEVFTGVRSKGWRRRFRLADYRDARIAPTPMKTNGRTRFCIEAVPRTTAKVMRIGLSLSHERQAFVAGILREMILAANGNADSRRGGSP